MRYWRLPGPRGLAGQIAAVVIFALLLTQAITGLLAFVLTPREPPRHPEEIATRIAMALRALDAAPPESGATIARALSGEGLTIALAPRLSLPTEASPGADEGRFLHRAIERELDAPKVTFALRFDPAIIGEKRQLDVAARLSDGRPVSISAEFPPPPDFFGVRMGPFVFSLPFLAVAILMLSVWATRRVTAPLRAFAIAAERLGNEQSAPMLADEGPLELRRAAQAFNRMQKRLKQFIDDRTRMLAAISHDLRTPLTRLRLRIEACVDDGEDHAKMLQDIRRMEAMIASALFFLREGAIDEAMEVTDVASLLQTICDDFVEAGCAVNYHGPATVALCCRPRMLGRAVTNLIENGVKYGSSVEVALTQENDRIVIDVADDGPGIADSDKERAFDPFYRLDAARGVETGGVGLGLSIARAIVQSHGGEIRLGDRQPQGLHATMLLPARRAV